MNKSNVIICSKNRKITDVSSSSVNVNLNIPLKCSEKEFFTVSVSSFNTIKSFYSIQNGLNNKFFIVIKGENGAYNEDFVRYIPEGNYNVKTLLVKMKELCFGLVNVEYDKVLNKLKFMRVENSIEYDINNYDFYIRCENCGVILGFDDGVEKLITVEPVFSDKFVNISGYFSLILKLGGLSMTNSYINMTYDDYGVSRMIGIIDVASVMAMDSIIFNGDSGERGQYLINEKIISNFSIDIVNENNILIPNMSDYVLNLVFEKHTYPTDVNVLFNTLMARFDDLIYYISYLFQYFNIV
jgi:hypothetical protein